MKKILFYFSLLFLIPKSGYCQPGDDFIRRLGDNLVVDADEQTIYLRGINFSFDRIVTPDGEWILGTCTELNDYPSTISVTNWYSEQHLQSITDIGFNVIRMDLHYRIFEDDSDPGNYKASGWTFLDTYVQWAKNNNLYLIFDMHVPQGGLQPSGGGGACLWDDPGNRIRFINLWQAIAQRYANEPQIAGYDLLNEPQPTGNSLQEGVDKYRSLMQQSVDSIRSVDQNHLIIIERINWIMNFDGTSPLSDFTSAILDSFKVTVDDSSENVMYDFHYYSPVSYALQYESDNHDGGNYPDTTVIEITMDGTHMPRDKNLLAYELSLELENRSNQPLFVGEWGPNPSTFNDVKGGYRYIRDILDLFSQNNLHWTYFYVNNLYDIECCPDGLECCYGDNPTTPAYPELIDLFTDYFDSTIASMIETNNGIPTKFVLEQNYPNPFNPRTTIEYQLPVSGHISLRIYNVLGEEIRTLVEDNQPAGSYSVIWNGKDATGESVTSGMYFYKLKIGESLIATRKMLLLK